MIYRTTYIRPNITIEHERIGQKKFYVFNHKGINYKVFQSLRKLRQFLEKRCETWIFECASEKELDRFYNP
ncbi:hypothetical protein A2662_03765 [Candidatus Giovannonibacteria bacterium RIFCSPHIGHO2_01_FULL_45_33]|uniref:Uncharacterized protein n=1 Tax=Candidatus Giovannonibacteria bacterium RIFCSPLOWO2_01_FULL_45_34 TaxID=1798351 RepID=A0A1F5X002_9BACT|nr:MAG: hypothetical protein A2662_03765 [Candidatus Giovannonibacteria bacterium RIFCSPHIGHO2_01_FULL_45_33]OGF68815.1 MAG: hypothetical protein A3C73_01990 [Candidatus Giovannonibacteria bacterium RIFCSPHIGHO2_02_FULL_44_11]OGF81222.1 MAG: hypothetical protein A2930_02030 [Candidatus Giovannonibacteria bacterium RIFCSPLOWO2_01_FULL_45_34]